MQGTYGQAVSTETLPVAPRAQLQKTEPSRFPWEAQLRDSGIDLTLMVPCLNEQDNIERTLENIAAAMARLPFKHEVTSSMMARLTRHLSVYASTKCSIPTRPFVYIVTRTTLVSRRHLLTARSWRVVGIFASCAVTLSSRRIRSLIFLSTWAMPIS